MLETPFRFQNQKRGGLEAGMAWNRAHKAGNAEVAYRPHVMML
jgi:hypothetical protein